MSAHVDDQLTEGGPAPPEYDPPQDSEPGPVDDSVDEDSQDEDLEPEPDEDDPSEILEPKVDPVERHIGPDLKGQDGTYVQRGLTWFGKIELYGLLGRALKIVMEGEGGLGIDDLMAMRKPRDMFDKLLQAEAELPGADTAPDASDKKNEVDATQMLAAFARIISVSPKLFYEFYCIALGAPKGHYKWLIEWGLPTIDDEMGSDILHTFIDQNWGAVEDFFAQELPKMAKRAAQAHERRSSGARSRR